VDDILLFRQGFVACNLPNLLHSYRRNLATIGLQKTSTNKLLGAAAAAESVAEASTLQQKVEGLVRSSALDAQVPSSKWRKFQTYLTVESTTRCESRQSELRNKS